jgi:hypothetical protein
MKMITGYQWGDDGSFIGPYAFPNNLDQEAIHLPPCTTLIAPPTDVPAGMEAAWDAFTEDWVMREEDLSWMPAPPMPIEPTPVDKEIAVDTSFEGVVEGVAP